MNAKSSSESELVGVDDLISTVLWMKYFIEAQGYNVEHNIIHQDIKSTLRKLINGKKSCTPRSKHIKAFFLAKDYHDKGESEFSKCKTGEKVGRYVDQTEAGDTILKRSQHTDECRH